MSDEDTTQEAEAVEAEEQQPTETETDAPEAEDAAEWDPERARRKIAKTNSENKALRDRATSAEKKAASADDLARANGDLTVTNMQLDVGYDLGLPKSLALRLKGSTREEMLADAETLVEMVAPAKRPATRRPAEVLRGGGAPTEEPEETDTRKLGARMFEH